MSADPRGRRRKPARSSADRVKSLHNTEVTATYSAAVHIAWSMVMRPEKNAPNSVSRFGR
jgi:hypothetical protein